MKFRNQNDIHRKLLAWVSKTKRFARSSIPTKPVKVPVDRILRGGERFIPANRYARLTGDLLRPSTPISEGPHVKLLEAYQERGDQLLSADEFAKTPYFANAEQCISYTGAYFPYIKTVTQVQALARKFVQMSLLNGTEGSNLPGHSPKGSPILVRKIAYSDHYELVDGNHRVAAELVRGATCLYCAVTRDVATTPAQDALLDVLWQEGRTEVYQPISLPEVATWDTLRKCSDRSAFMIAFLKADALSGARTYIDIGCSYGWFVAEMEKAGYDATGVERDPFALRVGQMVYRLRENQLVRSGIEDFLEKNKQVWDVVSCFSVLHHFVLGRGSIDAKDLVIGLDRITRSVLFLDSGTEDEEWFSQNLRGFGEQHIEEFVLRVTSFKWCVKLGRDGDRVGKFANNYRRMVFAFGR
jgi:SAM-dependent methyltransferase